MPDLFFRHLDVSPDDPVSTWPTEAIAPALERGGIEHWARLAAAEEVRHLLSASGMTRAAAARELGTSASRLSTYASGAVSPSAAFMVALRRLTTNHTPT